MNHDCCHLFLFLLAGTVSQGQSADHPESLSELLPPGTTVLAARGAADGPTSAGAVVTHATDMSEDEVSAQARETDSDNSRFI